MRLNYIESNIEEDIDVKNQFRMKNSPNLNSIRETASMNYFDSLFYDPTKSKNTAHVDFHDQNLDSARCEKVNSMPAVRGHLTAEYYVDEAISNSVDESSLFWLDLDEKLKLDQQDSIFLSYTLISPKTMKETPTKTYVVSLSGNDRKGRDLLKIFMDKDKEFDKNNLTKLDSITVNRNSTSDEELANKKLNDDSWGEGIFLRSNQSLQNCLKLSWKLGNLLYSYQIW